MTSELSTSAKCKEHLIWRMFMAIVTSVCVQFIFMTFVILIVNFRIMHPLTWIINTWNAVTCFRTWSYFLILATVIFLQGVICSKDYLTPPVYRKSRFSIVCNMFKPHNLLVGGLHILVGGVLVWLHLSLQDERLGLLTVNCDGEETCLVEENFFLLLGGFWIGFYFFVKSNFHTTHLQFPIVPRSKFSQIKGGIGYLLPHAAMNALSPVLCFIFFYYIDGGYCRETVLSIFSIKMKDVPLDTLYGLLNISLFFYTWLFTTLFLLTTYTMHLSFEAHLTQRMVFDIEQQSLFADQSSGMCLADALATDQVPIIQHLAYYDLVTLAQKEKPRRSILFTLSTPGGRPCNWNSIAVKCMGLLNSFTLEVNQACATNHKLLSGPTNTSTSGKLSETSYPYKMRNLTAARLLAPNLDSTIPPLPKQNSNGDLFITQFLRSKRQEFITYLLSVPMIRYVFEETLEEKIRYIFRNAQPVIWAAEGISSLIVISLKEDQYGVIQQDLPTIIRTLLSLKEALDKLHKANIFVKKSQSDDKEIRQMMMCLISTIKRSIYRITTTFKDYIEDLPLEPDIIGQLQSFLSYRE
ncbi:nucleoporin NDC1 [Neodiprion lecontei]|uniref:Nucleoporin NDC1 n=1 Tax=Neodiprion lecontei TaxID=441921 RepID=A0A6J0C7I7_NEOLC|nr:nucleoporin NDC1 [Neodiprion lecontei]